MYRAKSYVSNVIEEAVYMETILENDRRIRLIRLNAKKQTDNANDTTKQPSNANDTTKNQNNNKDKTQQTNNANDKTQQTSNVNDKNQQLNGISNATKQQTKKDTTDGNLTLISGLFVVKLIFIYSFIGWEKGRDLTRSYDKKTLHKQKCQKGKVTTQTTPQKSGCGPT